MSIDHEEQEAGNYLTSSLSCCEDIDQQKFGGRGDKDGDFIQYHLFMKNGDKYSSSSVETATETATETGRETESVNIIQNLFNLIDRINELIYEYVNKYIWQKDRFQIKLWTGINSNIEPHVFGRTYFGDCIDDEWFIVYLLINVVSKSLGNNVIIRIFDNDGEFLLIEAALSIPKFLQPDNSRNRVFIIGGRIHIIPPPSSPIDIPSFSQSCNKNLSISSALKFLREFGHRTLVEKNFEESIWKRISEYPEKANQNTHRASCILPSLAASVIRHNPSLVAPAVIAFYERTPLDLKKIEQNPRFCSLEFPKKKVIVRFSRCLYAQLVQQKLTYPRVFLPFPDPSSHEFKQFDLGCKLSCGLEILYRRSRERKHQSLHSTTTTTNSSITISNTLDDDDFSSTNLLTNKEWLQFSDSLNKMGYFKNSIVGSSSYQHLQEKSKRYFQQFHWKDSNPEISEVVDCVLKESFPFDFGPQEGESELEDSDEWLNIDPDTIFRMLEEKQKEFDKYDLGSKTFHDGAASDGNFTDILDGMNRFVNEESGFEGITGKGKSEVFDDEVNKNISLDPQKFVEILQNFVSNKEDFIIEENNDDTELEFEDSDDEKDDFLEHMMDDELQQHPALQSDCLNSRFDVKNLDNCNLELDKHLVKNLLESYSNQQGKAGPFSNIFSEMK